MDWRLVAEAGGYLKWITLVCCRSCWFSQWAVLIFPPKLLGFEMADGAMRVNVWGCEWDCCGLSLRLLVFDMDYGGLSTKRLPFETGCCSLSLKLFVLEIDDGSVSLKLFGFLYSFCCSAAEAGWLLKWIGDLSPKLVDI